MKTIAEIEMNGQLVTVQKKEDNLYDILFDDEVKQPNHDAEGIIRALAHYLHNTDYQLRKLEKNQLPLSNKP